MTNNQIRYETEQAFYQLKSARSYIMAICEAIRTIVLIKCLEVLERLEEKNCD